MVRSGYRKGMPKKGNIKESVKLVAFIFTVRTWLYWIHGKFIAHCYTSTYLLRKTTINTYYIINNYWSNLNTHVKELIANTAMWLVDVTSNCRISFFTTSRNYYKQRKPYYNIYTWHNLKNNNKGTVSEIITDDTVLP